MTIDCINHIAILVCDLPVKGLTEHYGDYGDCCEKLLRRGGVSLPIIKYQIAHASDEHFVQVADTFQYLSKGLKSGNIKAVMLTGSQTDSFATDVFWVHLLDDFIQNCLFKIKLLPILGICFGMQILSKNLGCKVNRNPVGWEIGTTKIDLNPSILGKFPFKDFDHTSMYLSEFHQDMVFDLPSHVSRLGSSSKCQNQGIVSTGDLNLLALQGHPEFSTEFSLAFIEKKLQLGLINERQYEDAIASTRKHPNMGYEFAKVIVNFIENHA